MAINQNKYIMNLTEIKESTRAFQRTINLHRRDKKPIEIDEIKKIYDKYIPAGSKCIIRALNNVQWYTLKSLNEDDLNLKEYTEYWNNKVKDATKFEKFFQLSICVIQPK